MWVGYRVCCDAGEGTEGSRVCDLTEKVVGLTALLCVGCLADIWWEHPIQAVFAQSIRSIQYTLPT